MEGVLIVSPWKRPSVSLPPEVMRKIFGSGHGGEYVVNRSAARGERISMPWAASPPSTFCQENVTTSSLAKSSGCANAAEVASQIVKPWRFAGIQLAFGTRTPDVVPFQVKTTSVAKSTLVRSGNSP